MKTKRITKSVISIALIMCMLMSSCITVFATLGDYSTGETINYVSFGDSMTNGYGLEGYETELGENVNGYLQIAPDAYPAQFANWLESETGADVNLTQLAVSGMRAEDLYFALSYDWKNADRSRDLADEYVSDDVSTDSDKFAADYAGFGDNYTYDHFVDGKFNDICGWGNYNLAYYCTACEKTYKGSLARGNIYLTDANYNDKYYDSQGNEYKYSDNVCEHVKVDNLTKNNPVEDADVIKWYAWDTDRDGIYEETPPTYKYVIPYCGSSIGNDYGNVWFGNATAAVAAQYQNAVEDADIISIGAGNANFGVFILHRYVGATVSTMWGSDDFYWICADDYIETMENEVAKSVAEMAKPKIKEMLGLDPDVYIPAISYEELQADPELESAVLYNLLMYTTASYMVNYRNILDRIAKLNPDAEIVIVGLMNAMNGITMIGEDGNPIDLTATMETLFGYINTYLAFCASYLKDNYPAYENINFYYAEKPTVDVIANDYDHTEYPYTEGDEVYGKIYDVTRKRFIDAINEKVLYLLGDLFTELGSSLGVEFINPEFGTVDPHSEWKDEWDAWKQDPTACEIPNQTLMNGLSQSEQFSSAVYLAFEESIIEGTKSGVMDMSVFSLLSDMNNISAMFGQVGEEIEAKMTPDVIMGVITENLTDWLKHDTAAKYELIGQFSAFGDYAPAAAYLYSIGVTPNPGTMQNDLLNSPLGFASITTTLQTAIFEALMNEENENFSAFDTLFNMFGRMVIGDGIGMHPSEVGYKDLADAVIAAYSDPSFKLDYTASKDSYYVSLGDASAVTADESESFADKLADEFNFTNGRYSQLAVDGMRADDLYYILDPENHTPDAYSTAKYSSNIEALNAEYVDEIEKADLITLSFSSNSFIEFATNQLDLTEISSYLADYDVENYEADLELYLGENTELVEGMLSGLISGAASSDNEIMNEFVDNYMYAVVGYMLHYSKVVDRIHAINPTAEVILLGMDNALSGLVLTDSESGTSVALGDTFDKVVKILNSYNRTCALTSDNTVYINVPNTAVKGPQNDAVQAEVMNIVEEKVIPAYVDDAIAENSWLQYFPVEEIIAWIIDEGYFDEQINAEIDAALPGWDDEVTTFNGEISLLRFMLEIALVGTDGMQVNDNGHEYIKDQILAAMTVKYDYELGDVNHDGVINTFDALAVLKYYVGSIGEDQIDISLSDVNGDNIVNTFDALDILYYYVGTITEFSGSK